MFLFWEVWWSGGSELEFFSPPVLLTKNHLNSKIPFACGDALWLAWKVFLLVFVPSG